MRPLTEEELRVLRAAEMKRLVKDDGRWRILFADPPDKRAREHLQRSGLIDHPVLAKRKMFGSLYATEKGSAALDAYDDMPF